MQDSHHQINRPLYILAAVYFLWLTVILLVFGYTPTNDGTGYLEFAEYCLTQGEPYPTATLYREIPFVWNIGIINLTALSLWVSGTVWLLLLLLCLIKSITCLMVGLVTHRLFNEQRIAITAMLLFMLYPNNWGQSTMISSEIPSTCLAIVAVYLAITQRNLFLSGLLLACANWFRPTATIFLVSIVVFLLIFNRRKLFQHIGQLAVGFAIFIVIVGTSTYLRTGHFVYQSRSYWFSMVDECYDDAATAPHWGQPVWPEGTPRYIENHETMDCFQFEEIWRERSLEWLKHHPIEYLKKIPGRLYYLYQSDYDNMTAFCIDKSQPENNYITLPYRHLLTELPSLSLAQWLSLISMVCYIILLITALYSIITLIRQRQYKAVFLPAFIVIVGSLALVLVMHGETRFKDPLMPYMFILASAQLQHPLNRLYGLFRRFRVNLHRRPFIL